MAAVSQTSGNTGGIEDYVLNIFCTEKYRTYVKAISGSGVFLSDPDEESGIILTNAHVARHLLDSNKQCVGRTGNPALTTHKLTLRYIPSYWLNVNNQYIIGDPDQSSTGEFDFALIEVKRISKMVKKKTLYDVLRQRLELRVNDYQPAQYNSTNYYIYSYPAQKTLSVSIYSPLYRKKDVVTIGGVFQSPTLRRDSNLLDAIGSQFVDHGSSGGMMLGVDTVYSLIGLSTILIQDRAPQTVRIVTMRHVFDVLDSELNNIQNSQSENYLALIRQILGQNKVDQSLYSILKSQKLTSTLEKNTRDTLIQLHIISK
ncbi:MAG: hypothetical protein RJB39_278 [Candidatus Parcubacteria bacterium]|jgi:hypothetical protein